MNALRLTFIGRDSSRRPVYENDEGQLFKDADPDKDSPPKICTCSSLDGEADTPLEYTSRYKDVKVVEFIPSRMVW